MNTTRIVKKIDKSSFKDMIDKYKTNIDIDPHALDHLSEAQRGVFSPENLKKMVLNENPVGVGLQKNRKYSAFYRRKEGYIRIVLNITKSKAEIITFLYTEHIPHLDRLKNENQTS